MAIRSETRIPPAAMGSRGCPCGPFTPIGRVFIYTRRRSLRIRAASRIISAVSCGVDSWHSPRPV